MPLIFGVHVLCDVCEGSGKLSSMTDQERRERSRELRRAKRSNEPVRKIEHAPCFNCDGLGYIEKGKGL